MITDRRKFITTVPLNGCINSISTVWNQFKVIPQARV